MHRLLSRRALVLLASCALLLAAGSASLAGPDDPAPAAAPDWQAIAKKHAPQGWGFATAVRAKGMMTYVWNGTAWDSRGAVADLTNVTPNAAGVYERTGATYPGPYGPTWDFGGDRLVLQTSEKVEGAEATAVDWARLCVRTVTAQGGNGGWSYLLMVATEGGKVSPIPPQSGVALPPQGTWIAAPFSCTYLILTPTAPAPSR